MNSGKKALLVKHILMAKRNPYHKTPMPKKGNNLLVVLWLTPQAMKS